MGYALTGPAIAAVLNGCKPKLDHAFHPQFFTNAQITVISQLAEIIIPRTDTPGAIDAGVPMFIDGMLKEVYPEISQQAFLKNLKIFDNGAKKMFGTAFSDCSSSNQVEYFRKHHDECLNSAEKQEKPFIVEVKELTLLGFFTSEIGATQVLNYKQVPGPYKGCVPLAEVGKAWAT